MNSQISNTQEGELENSMVNAEIRWLDTSLETDRKARAYLLR